MKKIDSLFLKQLYAVFVLNLLVLFIIALQYIKFLENIDGFFLKPYLIVTATSHFFLIGALPLLFSLLIYFTTLSKIVTKTINIILSVFILIVVKLDATIFEQFRYHISPIVLKLVFGKRASDIFQFSFTNIVLALLFIVGLVLLQLFFYFLSNKKVNQNSNLRLKPTLVLFTLFVLLSNVIYAWSDANYFRPVTQFKNVFPLYYPLTADSLMMKLNLVDEEKIRRNEKMAIDSEAKNIKYPLNAITAKKSNTQKNILYIVIDSWRKDFMSEQITPNIYKFSKNCQLFQNHSSGSNMTTGGIFTIFYGIPATYYDTFTGQQIAPVFISELQKQNYEMLIFSSSNLENPPFNRNVFANVPNLELFTTGETPSERDSEINKKWLSNIEKTDNKKPFFGFLFYDSAHGFDYPKNYKLPFSPSLSEVNFLDLNDDYNPKQLINRYKNSLHFVDSLVGEVLLNLDKKGVLKNTIVVITSDHGQEFNDNKKGYWQHGGNFSDYQIGVPMLVFDASKAPKIQSQQTLHYDIVPTMMKNYLGIKNNFIDYSFGQDLYQPCHREGFICGYNQRFAIIEKNQIINIYPSGLFDATDKKLNALDDSKINYDRVSTELKNMNRFYKK
jgi:membrane-anchored protein YejM (alkaline phosphatase superfamily)